MAHVRTYFRKRYLYRNRTVNGKSLTVYVGPEDSPAAQLALEQERQAAERRAEEKRQTDQAAADLQQLDEEMENLSSLVTEKMKACLEAAGYHQHDRGAWRRRKNNDE
jgi:hypothetical protein